METQPIDPSNGSNNPEHSTDTTTITHPDHLPPCKNPLYVRESVTKQICQRHSTRAFLPTAVPTTLMEEVLSLAQHAPSNSNVQPWRIHIVTDTALARLSTRLMAVVESGFASTTAPIPEEFRKYRSALGKQIYGPEGYNVRREDVRGSKEAQMRNYRFFGAPVGVIVCMDDRLAQIDALSVGMWLQCFCMLLAERGIGTCVEASVVGYPDAIREELSLPANMIPLTGVAVGFEDESQHVNKMKIQRDAWKDSVRFSSD